MSIFRHKYVNPVSKTKVSKKKIFFDKYVILFFLTDLISVWLTKEFGEKYVWISLVSYSNFLIYTRLCLVKKWVNAIKVWALMIITIPCLQLMLYYGTKFALEKVISKQIMGILINILISLIFLFWKNKYTYIIFRSVNKIKNIIFIFVFGVLFSYLLYMYNFNGIISPSVMIPVMGGITGFCLVFVLWTNAEYEKKSKAKEVQLYELYNKTFEEAINTIRTRQHEFDNHINAIKCLNMTIHNPQELINVQNEYCDKLLEESSDNRLLKMNGEPLIIGFLYSKFMNARKEGIIIEHQIQAIEFRNKIKIVDLIEVLGVMIDNAIEALRDEKFVNKKLIVRILCEDGGKIVIEVSNRSKKYLNNEIEKFCMLGYTTKGEKRGMGLSRVVEIVKNYKGDFFIGNVSYDEQNYLCFKIII